MRKSATDYRDAPFPTNAKLRAFRCLDFSDMSREDRLAYANAVHAAIRADNQRRGQSYKPVWKSVGECQRAYDAHMKEQRSRKATEFWTKPLKPLPVVEPVIEPIVEPVKPSILPALLTEHFDQGARKLAEHLIDENERRDDVDRAVSRFAVDLGMIVATVRFGQRLAA